MEEKNQVIDETYTLLALLEERFHSNMNRHEGLSWVDLKNRLLLNKEALASLDKMEKSGGEPDVVKYDRDTDAYIFMDCSKETPVGRRSICYDRKALDARKQNKPDNSAVDMANEIGITLLTEEEYRYLQTLGDYDLKTSSWLKTPDSIRKLGGALFGDKRYDTVFIYHNGADSYYAVRGFRGVLRVK